MNETLYASFVNINDAERAIGALMDHGVKPKSISMVAHELHGERVHSYSASNDLDLKKLDDGAKGGISTTTTPDAEAGAAKGAGIGLGVGVAAALAALFLPGIGLVVGGGALALAVAGAAGVTGAGAISGGVLGYLKDQGVDEKHVTTYSDHIEAGGAVVAVDLDNSEDRTEIENVLTKYSAQNFSRTSTNTVR
jgi:hypothetical protein